MRVAVTGGIAEGKSTVLGFVRDLGYETDSADDIARSVFALDHVQREIAEAAGVQYPVDRDLLREQIALNPSTRHRINAITHPLIVQRLSESSAQFFEVPLLLETCLQGQFDRVWVVTCGAAEQVRRLIDRYGRNSQMEALMRSQLPTRAKTPFSDRVIRTNDDLETVRRLVSEAVTVLLGSKIAP